MAQAAEHGGGVLLTYGNYAGDVLQLHPGPGAAARPQGIACRIGPVTDDVSTAPVAERAQAPRHRRGPGGLQGRRGGGGGGPGPRRRWMRAANRANDRTRSFGVAFTGCTLPGRRPLRCSPCPKAGWRSASGIHGEPGIGRDRTSRRRTSWPTLFVARLLAEMPDDVPMRPRRARVVAVLNGLGTVKYEELFVVYGRIATLLADGRDRGRRPRGRRSLSPASTWLGSR